MGAPALIAGMFVLTLAVAAPLAIVLRGAIEAHLGRSLMADAAVEGVNYDWWQEFAAQAGGVGATFSPAIIGFAATLDNISSVMDAQREAVPVAVVLAAYLLIWTFLSGGILDRYARQRPTRAYGFFAAAGVYFWRFLRLALMAGVAYWFLFSYVHPWLFDDAYTRMTRDLTAERRVFLWRAAFYMLFGAALIAVNITFDYAKIRIVVEDRRSTVGALRAALGFIARHPAQTFGLYGLNGLVFVVVVATWAVLAPGAGGAGWPMWAGLAAAQIYLLARLLVKLQFMASQTANFQRSLAHAAYTARPAIEWPESPAAETVR